MMKMTNERSSSKRWKRSDRIEESLLKGNSLNLTNGQARCSRLCTTKSSRRGRSCLLGNVVSRSLTWLKTTKLSFCKDKQGLEKLLKSHSFCWRRGLLETKLLRVLSREESLQCLSPNESLKKWTLFWGKLSGTRLGLKIAARQRPS